MNPSNSSNPDVTGLITLSGLQDELAVSSAQAASSDARVVNAVGRQNGGNGAHLLGAVLYVEGHVEWLAVLDLVHLDQVEVDILVDLGWEFVDGLSAIHSANGVQSRQAISW